MFKIETFTLALLTTLSCASFSQTLPAGSISYQQKAIADAMKTIDGSSSPKGQTRLQLDSNAMTMNATDALQKSDVPVSKATTADFMNLSRPGSGTPPGKTPKTAAESDLLVFVSLSMPDQMLVQYATQAKRFHAVLMLRGFVDEKLSATREALTRLNATGAQWEISPEPFKTFKINKVPAIVLATAESASVAEDGCAKPETYTSIFGDIAIVDALDKMSLLGQKRVASLAKARLVADRLAGKQSSLQ